MTSDYLVRGISRTDHRAAIQGDVHIATAGGLIAGAFASDVQFDTGDPRSAELSAFAGFAWRSSGDWQARALSSYYGYVGNAASRYNYAEFTFETVFRDWLDLEVVYSPDDPRYVSGRGLSGVSGESVEATVRSPWRNHLAATGGLGYSYLGGAGGGGYAYWSVGGVLDLAPALVALSYVGTGAGAERLFFGAAARNRASVTVIWRF